MLGIRRYLGTAIDLWQGDLTTFVCDAMVNAASPELAGGGGVDGAIHAAGGPSIMEECRRLGGCAVGSAVVTGAGQLPARWLLHAVGPRWHDGNHNEAELLAGAHARCLSLAAELGARHIALPAISTGVYGYPVAAAADVALRSVASWLQARAASAVRISTGVQRVTFVLFTKEHYRAFQAALFATFPEPETGQGPD